MKVVYGVNIEDMFYKYAKYTSDEIVPVNKSIYKNKVEEFMRRLNELENEFGFSISAEYSEDNDGWTEAHLELNDNMYGYVGEIEEEN